MSAELFINPQNQIAIRRSGLGRILFTPRPISMDRVSDIAQQPELGRRRPFGYVANGGYMIGSTGLASHLVAVIGRTFYDVDLLASDEQKDNTVAVQFRRGFYKKWVLNVPDANETVQRISSFMSQQ